MNQSTEVVIIGAGVIGCSIAYALRKQGVAVMVLDKGEVGAQASQAATGMLAPLKPFAKTDDPYTRLLLSSLALFPDLVAELEQASGICLEYEETGSLRLMRPQHLARVQAWVTQWQQAGFPVALLIGEELFQHEPSLASHFSLAVLHTQEPQLHASHLVQAYAQAAKKLGAVFCTHEEVIGLAHHHSRISGVHTAQGKMIACEQLVLASGAWAAQSQEWLDLALPVAPLRGQSIAMRQPASPIRHLLFGEGIYLAPKKDGTLIAAVARDEAGFEVETTQAGMTWLYERACRLVPALKASAIEDAWAGLLPKTPDARPILGFAPGWENVILACGYNGYGLLLSALTAPLIAEQIITGQLPAPLQPFMKE
jgi:glycine oxidase